jgi:hypothetical protein
MDIFLAGNLHLDAESSKRTVEIHLNFSRRLFYVEGGRDWRIAQTRDRIDNYKASCVSHADIILVLSYFRQDTAVRLLRSSETLPCAGLALRT